MTSGFDPGKPTFAHRGPGKAGGRLIWNTPARFPIKKLERRAKWRRSAFASMVMDSRTATLQRFPKRDGVEPVTADDKKKSNAIVDEDVVRTLARLLDETRLTEIEIE